MNNAIIGQIISFYGYCLVFSLGFIGHVCSLITFSSKTLRQTSTGLLFIALTISDVLYLSIQIHDFLTFVVKITIIQNEYLCRAYTFIISFSTVTAAWFLLLIAVDRWIRAYFPFQHGRICTRKITINLIITVCIGSTIFAYHILRPIFISAIGENELCEPIRSPLTSYTNFYFHIWPILQLLITYIIPSCVIIICSISVYSKIRIQKIRILTSIRREQMQRQMLKLMISSSICFIICTVPYAIYRIVYLRLEINSIDPIITSILSFLININHCVNFYIYCLSSKCFRETFIQQLKQVYIWIKKHRERMMIVHSISANIQVT